MFLVARNPNPVDITQIAKDAIKEIAGYDMKDDDLLNVPHADYFRKLESALELIPETDLLNYLTFREVFNLAPVTTSTIRDLFHQWNAIITGSTVPTPR